MAENNQKLKVIECRAADNEYLHKDFYGALCYSLKYLDEKYGPDTTEAYLQQVGKTCYAPLSTALKEQGLSALEKHWEKIFGLEDSKFSLSYEGQKLVLIVDECPAIAYLKKICPSYAQLCCKTTIIVNETICREAGYCCSCDVVPGEGKCVQKFWKEGAAK